MADDQIVIDTGNSEMNEQFKVLLDMYAPEELDPELRDYVSQGATFMLLRHPLVYCVPYTEAQNKQTNRFFHQKKAALQAAITEGDWHQFIFLHERPYRFDALEAVLFTHEVEDPKTVWPLIAKAWTDSENIWQNFDRWREIWEGGPDKRAVNVMSPDERRALNAMPKTFEVYRGAAFDDSISGLSWTIDRDRAVWFARRYSQDEGRKPMLATGTVRRIDVLAHFLGRNEQEMVVLPEYVQNVGVVTL